MPNFTLAVHILSMLLLMTFPLTVEAYPGKPLRLEQLVQTSDVIAVVNIDTIRSTEEVSIDVEGNRLLATADVAAVRLVRLIKGTCPTNFTIDFNTPLQYVGYPGISSGTKMVFLRAVGENFTFTDRHYPRLPAANRSNSSPPDSLPSDPLQAVADEMGLIMSQHEYSLDEKVAVVNMAYAIPARPSFTSSLLAGLEETNDVYLKSLIESELIRRNDVSHLLLLASELLMNRSTPAEQRQNLLSAIANRLTNPEAVPVLIRLVESADIATRRAASEALWHIAEPSSKNALIKALSDPDPDVRYHAVRALAQISGQDVWAPSVSEFELHQKKYLDHWHGTENPGPEGPLAPGPP
ncbi:MAG: hypothetical protein JWO91_3409 [Acidobacteriaceae bacterium]|nr:hypothetical protein [Acidobacteriaceae bacterium]